MADGGIDIYGMGTISLLFIRGFTIFNVFAWLKWRSVNAGAVLL